MYSHGLKINIMVTLALLIGGGIIMVNFVTLMLWQRDLNAAEINSGKNMIALLNARLHNVDFSTQQREVQNNIDRLLRDSDVSCAIIQAPDVPPIIAGSTTCAEQNVADLLLQSQRSGTLEKKTFGQGWAVIKPGMQFLAMAGPLRNKQHVITGSLGIVIPLAPIYESIRGSLQVVFLYTIINILLLTLIGAIRLIKLTVRPVEKLVDLTYSYEDNEDLPFYNSKELNEFGQLSTALNRMLWRIDESRKELKDTVDSLRQANTKILQTQKELVQAEKLAAIGRLAAGLAHEIGNPIAIIQGYLGLLTEENLEAPEKHDFLRRAEQELQRISGLIRQLLDLARSSSEARGEARIHQLLSEVIAIVRDHPMANHTNIDCDFNSKNDKLLCNSNQLRQVFLNCLINAIDSVTTRHGETQNGEIYIYTENSSGSRPGLSIHFRDNGMGMAPNELLNIFDPFYTTKEPGKGTGLGLSVSHSIIQGHGGTIRAEGVPGKGAEIIIDLPLNDQPGATDHA